MPISNSSGLPSGVQVSHPWVEGIRQSLQKTFPSFGRERKMSKEKGRFISFQVLPQIFLTCVKSQQ